jgi:hypothetical protein
MESPREIDDARPGHFKVRLVKRGPWMPARLERDCACTVNGGGDQSVHPWTDTCDRHQYLRGEIDGMTVDVDRVWLFGEEITEDEFNYLTSSVQWDRENDATSPAARPREAIDLNTINPRRFAP